MLGRAYEALVGTLFPVRCVSCGSRGALRLCGLCDAIWPGPNAGNCMGCGLGRAAHTCPASAQGFEATWAAATYAGVARQAVHALKFHGQRALAGPLAAKLAACLPPGEPWLVVPVPMHAERKRQRGYNQAALLARALARRRHWPYREALRRPRATTPSPGLDRAARAKNMADAFTCDASVAGRRVLLVDDVLTTGATAHAAALALRAAGARVVHLAVVARTP